MSTTQICLRPLVLTSSVDGAGSGWGRVAGGPLRFSHAGLVDRAGEPGKIWSYQDLARSSDPQIRLALEKVEEPRLPVAGLSLSRPVIMGIVNVTPDSFSDGGSFDTTERAISHGAALVAAGADILDVGGESTRPGSDPVDESTELERILPVIEGLANTGALISCDTRKSAVMRQAVAAGAGLINDVSSLNHDPEARATAASLGVPSILMHAKGEPKIMQDAPHYTDVCVEVFNSLEEEIEACEAAGISRENIVADPGIGFGKTFNHNLELLDGLALFHGLGVPVMLGASRKGFIGALTGVKDAGGRAAGSVSAALAGLARGVQLFRVHDVKETAEAFAVWQGISRRTIR